MYIEGVNTQVVMDALIARVRQLEKVKVKP